MPDDTPSRADGTRELPCPGCGSRYGGCALCTYGHLPNGQPSGVPPLAPDLAAVEARANALRDFIQQHTNGGCRMLSLGDGCECPRCHLDALLTRVRAAEAENANWRVEADIWSEANTALRADVARLTEALQVSRLDELQWKNLCEGAEYRLATARAEALEEAAKVCDDAVGVLRNRAMHARRGDLSGVLEDKADTAETLAHQIRALAARVAVEVPHA